MSDETPAADVVAIQLVARFVASLTSNGANREHLLTINHDEIAAIVRDAQDALYRNPAAADEIARLCAENAELQHAYEMERKLRLEVIEHDRATQRKLDEAVRALEEIAARPTHEGGCYYNNRFSVFGARAALTSIRGEA